MSMTSDNLNPNKEPSMMYPQIGNLKPSKKFYTCLSNKGSNTEIGRDSFWFSMS
jgi:hypothetical protein